MNDELRLIREAEQARIDRLQATIASLEWERNSLSNELAGARGELALVHDALHHTRNEVQALRTSRRYRVGSALAGAADLLRRPAPTTAPGTAGGPAPAPDHPDGDAPALVVSVVLPVFNNGPGLLHSLESLFDQTFTAWEAVVWDDGSTDPRTAEILDQLEARGDPTVRVVRSENQGVIRARNAAVRVARGQLLCFLDPDDSIAPTYLEKTVASLRTRPSLAAAYSWQQNEGGRDDVWHTSDLHTREIAMRNTIPVAAVVRREAFALAGGYDERFGDGYEDWALWARIAALGFQGRCIPEPLFRYHYSDHAGRDSAARLRHDDLKRRIHAYMAESARPDAAPPRADQALPAHRPSPSRLPVGTRRPIVVFVPWLTRVGGAEQMLRDLVPGWVERGHAVAVITTEDHPPASASGYDQVASVTPFVYKLAAFLDRPRWPEFVRDLVQGLERPVIVNIGSRWCYEHLEAVGAWSANSASTVDVLFNHVGHVHDNQRMRHRIDVTVTAHRALEALLRDYFSRERGVRTIYVGIGSTAPQEGSGFTAPWRRDVPLVAWLGRLSLEKRPDWFLAAAQVLGDAADFVMCGDGPLAHEARTAAARSTNLRYLDVVRDVRPLLRSADVVTITSEVEGIPLTAMEALDAGTPVVASNVGGLAELVVPGTNGELFDPDHVSAFIETLGAVLRDPNHLIRLRKGAAAGLEARFTRASMADEWRALLDELEDERP